MATSPTNDNRYSADTALCQARAWHAQIKACGVGDVELIEPGEDLGDGRWRFAFRHTVTGAAHYLDTPDRDAWDEHDENPAFTPRPLWDGASDTEPKAEDWEW